MSGCCGFHPYQRASHLTQAPSFFGCRRAIGRQDYTQLYFKGHHGTHRVASHGKRPHHVHQLQFTLGSLGNSVVWSCIEDEGWNSDTTNTLLLYAFITIHHPKTWKLDYIYIIIYITQQNTMGRIAFEYCLGHTMCHPFELLYKLRWIRTSLGEGS